MEQVSWATGTHVKYAGKTRFVPIHKHGAVPKRGVDLVIAWAGTAAIKDFQGTTVGGVGGALRGWPGITRKGHRKVFRVQAAGVTLNADQWISGLQYPGWDGPTYTAGQVLLHEIGH